MTLLSEAKAAPRTRQRKPIPWQPPGPSLPADHLNRILSFKQWCELNGFSTRTGRRIIARGEGPMVTWMTHHRGGVTIENNAKWQASRERQGPQQPRHQQASKARE